MRRYIVFLICLIIIGTCPIAVAEPPKNIGPDIVNLKMGVMIVPFQHQKHQRILNNECFHCHNKNTAGKIQGWGKETAHVICIACHDLEAKGPVECHQCHSKKQLE